MITVSDTLIAEWISDCRLILLSTETYVVFRNSETRTNKMQQQGRAPKSRYIEASPIRGDNKA